MQISDISDDLNKKWWFPLCKFTLILYAAGMMAYSFYNMANLKDSSTSILVSLVLSLEASITSVTITLQLIAIQKKSPKVAKFAQIGFGAYMVIFIALLLVISFSKLRFGIKTDLIYRSMFNVGTFKSIKIFGNRVRKARQKFGYLSKGMW